MIYLVLFFTIICDILGKFFLAYLFMHAPFVQFDLTTKAFFYFSFFLGSVFSSLANIGKSVETIFSLRTKIILKNGAVFFDFYLLTLSMIFLLLILIATIPHFI